MILPPLNVNKSEKAQVRASRCFGGWVQLEISLPFVINTTVAITEENAIALCDQLRAAVEKPTQLPPSGENVVIMKNGGPR